jgi:hypothetical protein
MNMDRLKPGKGADLPTWLSSVVHDANRDAKTAGMPADEAWILMSIIARNCDPDAWRKRTYHENEHARQDETVRRDCATFLESCGHVAAADCLRARHE